jgi:hypothetical protein
MKTLKYLIFALMAGLLLVTISCDKDDDDDPPPPPPSTNPPVASFSIQSGSAVVNEYFKFTNNSSGNITSYQWDFGSGEGSSNQTSPSYKFQTVGEKTVTLNATGPGGSDSYSKTVTVCAMPPDCHNYSTVHNYDRYVILNLQNQGCLDYGRLVIINNYGADVKIEIYHPTDWKNEIYLPWGNYSWTVSPNYPNGSTLITGEGYFSIGGDWGIRVTFGNGVKSCIRTIHFYSKSFNYGGYNYLKVYASDIYENSLSWDKSLSIEEPGNTIKPVVFNNN